MQQLSPTFAIDASAVQASIEAWQWLPQLDCPCSPNPRCSHAACIISETQFAIVGGGVCDETTKDEEGKPIWQHFNDVWLFDSLEVAWKRLDRPTAQFTASSTCSPPPSATPVSDTDLVPCPRRGHGAVFYPKRLEIIIFGGTVGGLTGEENLLNDVWIFSLHKRTWSRAPGPAGGRRTARGAAAGAADFAGTGQMSLPPPRRGCASFLMDDGLYVVGGYVPADEGYFDPRVWRLDLNTWRWRVHLRSSEMAATTAAADVRATSTESREPPAPPAPPPAVIPTAAPALASAEPSASAPLAAPTPAPAAEPVPLAAGGTVCFLRRHNGEEIPLRPERFGVGWALFALSTAVVIGRDVWFFGGCSAHEPMNQIMRRLRFPPQPTLGDRLSKPGGYHQGGLVWTLFEPYEGTPAPRFCHGIAAVGGAGATSHRVDYLDDHDSASDNHSAHCGKGHEEGVQRRAASLSLASSSPLARYLVVFGGTGQDHQSFDDIYLFDTHLLTWRQLLENTPDDDAEMGKQRQCQRQLRPSPRNGFSMVPQGNKVVVFGGGVYPREYYNCTFAFDLNLPLEPPPALPPPAPFVCTPPESIPNDYDLTLLPGPRLTAAAGLPHSLSLQPSSSSSPKNDSPCRAHRRQLAARCPYFRSMLGGDGLGGDEGDKGDCIAESNSGSTRVAFAEANMDEIRLPEVPEDTLRVVLHYLYTGQLSFGVGRRGKRGRNTKKGTRETTGDQDQQLREEEVPLGADGYNAAQHVLHLASLWALDHLKELVEDAILRELLVGEGGDSTTSASSPAVCLPAAMAVPLLSLAETHQALKLRLFAMHAVVRNWDAVRATDDFATLPPHLKKETEWYARSLLL